MKSHFSYDFLEKVEKSTTIEAIFNKLWDRVYEAKQKGVDVKEQEALLFEFRYIQLYLNSLWEEKETLLKRNFDLELINLKLLSEISELKKELGVLEKMKSF